jgi:hypothetical protein
MVILSKIIFINVDVTMSLQTTSTPQSNTNNVVFVCEVNYFYFETGVTNFKQAMTSPPLGSNVPSQQGK